MLSAPNRLRGKPQSPQGNGALQYTVFQSLESCWIVAGGGSDHNKLNKLNKLNKFNDLNKLNELDELDKTLA